MHRNTKVATCCYCGTRAALVLDSGRHELTCQGCGAPLHELKSMPIRPGSTKGHRGHTGDTPHSWPDSERSRRPKKSKRKSKKKKKSMSQRFLSEAFDLIEDIFD